MPPSFSPGTAPLGWGAAGAAEQPFDEGEVTGARATEHDRRLRESLDGLDLRELSTAVARDASERGICFGTADGTQPFRIDPIPRVIELLNEKYSLAMPVEEVTLERERHYQELLPSIQAVPEILEVMQAYQGRLPFAVVSGSPRDSVIKTLSFLKVLDRFETVVTAEDYARGKPAPDAFLLAAGRLGVAPGRPFPPLDNMLRVTIGTDADMAKFRDVFWKVYKG